MKLDMRGKLRIEKVLSEYDKIYLLDSDVDPKIGESLKQNVDENSKVIDMKLDDDLKELYYLYDYSNSVNPIIENNNYPTLFNYYDQGILTEDELIEALLK